jgi:hypothetical protein
VRRAGSTVNPSLRSGQARRRSTVRLFRLTSHLSLLLALTACAVTPLSRRIRVGEEPFVIGIGEGSDSMTDLFAAPAGGGEFLRLTFTRAEERLPRSPEGPRRSSAGGAGNPRWVLVVLDLRTPRSNAAASRYRARFAPRSGRLRRGPCRQLLTWRRIVFPDPVSRRATRRRPATRELLEIPAAMVGRRRWRALHHRGQATPPARIRRHGAIR